MTFNFTLQTGDGIPQIYNEIVNTVLLAVVFQSHQKFHVALLSFKIASVRFLVNSSLDNFSFREIGPRFVVVVG